MNPGITMIYQRYGYICFNSHMSCLKQIINPQRFISSEETGGMFVWTNGNGDYYFDKNYEETAVNAWACNDIDAVPITYCISCDDNLFSLCSVSDAGSFSFGVLAPDGTCLGYCAAAGEGNNRKLGSFFVDGNTPFDGLYTNKLHVGPPGGWIKPALFNKTYFLAHDSISGIITSVPGTAIEQTEPVEFTLAHNTPNPFNPVTSIFFTLPHECAIELTVYNVGGTKIATLADGVLSAGEHSVVWDASGFPSGVYFYRLKGLDFEGTGKMTLVK